MPQTPEQILLFHFTAISNLDSIFRCGCLKSYNILAQEGQLYTNIAYASVQEKRHLKLVPNTNTNLHDYVPFMFAPRSPMLYTLINGNVEEAQENKQENIIYFVTDFNTVSDLDYVFTDYHAILEYAGYYTNPQDFDKIQWPLFFEPPLLDGYCRYFHSVLENPKYVKRKEAREAEFLIKNKINLEKILYIAVFNEETQRLVEQKLRFSGLNISVQIKRDWYF